MAAGRVVAYGAAAAPTGWLLCDGASYLRSAYADLFDEIGTLFGAADGTHFNVPDMRDRFVLGKAASGTGSALAETGGALAHVHAGPSHSHGITQASAHSDHAVTQPDNHTALTHSGFGVADHAAYGHSGAGIAAHSVTKSSGHGSHASAGDHNHDAHTDSTFRKTGTGSYLTGPTGAHSTNGSHAHDSHSTHNESVSVHSVSSQGADHPLVSHAVTQSSAHTVAHSGLGVDTHSAHSGSVANDGSASTAGSNPAHLVLTFIIATGLDNAPAGVVVPNASASVPADHLLCDGASYLRATYADLFAVIGTTFGAADGTHFNVPDIRGRHVLGKSGSSAVGDAAGSSAHSHTGGAHVHVVSQPGDHSAHVITQAGSHSLTHTGAAITDHPSASHSGFAVSSHTVTQSSGHGTHSSAGSHNHNAHTSSTNRDSGSDLFTGPGSHNSEGGHTHDAHSAHAGAALGAHAETQASAHAAASHTVVQPDTHTIAHAGAALTGHSSHSGASVDSGGTAATSSDDVPYLGLHFVIRTVQSVRPIGTLFSVGQSAAPAGTLLCDGSSVLRATYADLFTAIGTTFGAVDGTHFSMPDLRGRIPRGAGGSGPALGAFGGALDHTHTGPSHTHTTVQPGAHSAHTATQPSDHAAEAHTGADVSNTHSRTHTGMSVAAHTETQANAHSAHSSASNHNHNAHTFGAAISDTIGSFVTALYGPTTHSNDGSHTHTGAHSHSGFGVDAHDETQANAHSLSHSGIAQPASHTLSAHAGFAVNAHSAHSGFATQAGGASVTGAANPPYIVLSYVIQALTDIEVHSISVSVSAVAAVALALSKQELEVPNTPPSSPIIFILEPPA